MTHKEGIRVKFSDGMGIFDHHFVYPEIDYLEKYNGPTGKVKDIQGIQAHAGRNFLVPEGKEFSFDISECPYLHIAINSEKDTKTCLMLMVHDREPAKHKNRFVVIGKTPEGDPGIYDVISYCFTIVDDGQWHEYDFDLRNIREKDEEYPYFPSAGSISIIQFYSWSGSGEHAFHFNDLVCKPIATTSKPFVVKGHVSYDDNMPYAIVRAFDKDLRKEELLGEAKTDPQGYYEIHYSPEQFRRPEKGNADLRVCVVDENGSELVSSELLKNAPAEAVIDLTLPSEKKQLSEYELLVNAISPLLKGQGKGGKDLPVTELNEKDIDFLAKVSGEPRERIFWLSESERRGQEVLDTGAIPAEVFYGWFRQNLPTSLTGLLGQDIKSLRAALERSVQNGVIPLLSGSELDDFSNKLLALKVSLKLKPADKDQIPSLGDLLKTTLLNPDKQRSIAALQLEHDGASETFWKALNEKKEFSEEEIKSVRLTLQLEAFTGSHMPLIHELQRIAQADQDVAKAKRVPVSELDQQKVLNFAQANADELRPFAKLDITDWKNLLMRPQPDGQPIGAPPTTPGADLQEKIDNYAAVLNQHIENVLPTAVIASRLEKDTGDDSPFKSVHADLKTFFDNNPSFEFKTMPVDLYLSEGREQKFENVTDHVGLKAQLKSMQRVFKITPRYPEMRALLADDLPSATAMVHVGERKFIEKYKEPLGGASKALEVYRKAEHVYATALNVYMKHSVAFNSPLPYVISGGERRMPVANSFLADNISALREVPDWSTLFGSLDLCDCRHCRSLYSPAAYLVDILRFLNDGPTKNGMTPLQILLGRRPDIEHIELTCENTDTQLPCVDLVNEILEVAIAPRLFVIADRIRRVLTALRAGAISSLIKTFFADNGYALSDKASLRIDTISGGGRNLKWIILDSGWAFTLRFNEREQIFVEVEAWPQTSWTSDELRANPEHIHDPAYAVLRKAVYPWNLPLNLPLKEMRTYLGHLGVKRHVVMETFFRGDPSKCLSEKNIALEYLGLTNEEANIITGVTAGVPAGTTSTPAPWDFWGLSETGNDIADPTDGMAQGAWDEVLQRVSIFQQQSGLGYKELLELLGTYFINPFATSGTPRGRLLGIVSIDDANPVTCKRSDLKIKVIDNEFRDDQKKEILKAAWDRIHRFVRLWRKLGWTMQELDKTITALDPPDLNDNFLIQLSHIQRMRAALNVPLETILSWYSIIDTATYIDHLAAGQPELKSFYEQLFLNKAVINPEDIAFLLNSIRNELKNPSAGTNHESIKSHIPAIIAALGISDADLSLILGFTQSISRQAVTSSMNGTGVDLTRNKNPMFVLDLGKITEADNRFSIKFQESNDNITYTDIPDSSLGGGGQPAVIDQNNSDQVIRRPYVGSNKFLRVAVTDVEGTSPGIIIQAQIVMVSHVSDEMNLANLSMIYRISSLAKALKLSIREWLIIRELSNINPFESTQATLHFAEKTGVIRSSGFGIYELDYLLRHDFTLSSGIALPEDAIALILDEIRRGLQKIAAENVFSEDSNDPNGMTTDLDGELTHKKLALLDWDAQIIEQVVATLRDAVTYEVPLSSIAGIVLPNDTGRYEVGLKALPPGFRVPDELNDIVAFMPRLLFTCDQEIPVTSASGKISKELCNKFKDNSIDPGISPTVKIETPDTAWKIKGTNGQYSVVKSGGILSIYDLNDLKLRASRLLSKAERDLLGDLAAISNDNGLIDAINKLFELQDELRGEITYDPGAQKLRFVGVMILLRQTRLKTASKDYDYQKAIDELFKMPRTFISRHMRTFSVEDFAADLAALPSKVTFPNALKSKVYFDAEAKKLHFIGVMTEQQRDALLGLSTDTCDPEHTLYQDAVKNLFTQPDALAATFLDDPAIANLFENPTVSADRFLLVLKKLLPYLRQILSERLVVQKIAETLNLEAKTAAELMTKRVNSPAHPAQKCITEFLEPNFAMSNLNVNLTDAAFSDQFRTFTRLHKIAGLIIKFKITPDQLTWLFEYGPDVGWLDPNALPTAPTGSTSALFAGWERLVDLFRLRDQLPEGESVLSDVFCMARDTTINVTYLFSWDGVADTEKVPGNEKYKLIYYLKDKFGLDWLDPVYVIIRKIDNGNTIKVKGPFVWPPFPQNYILIKLNNTKTKVNLTISTDKRTSEFVAKLENSKLNIYNVTNLQKETNLLQKLSWYTGWSIDNLQFLVGPQGLDFTFPDSYKDERALMCLYACFKLMKRLGASAEQLSKWGKVNQTPVEELENARSIKNMVKAKYDDKQWLTVAKPLKDPLREKQRAALVAYLITHPAKGQNWRDVNELYEYFLIDVEMSPCMMTTRIKQAISSVQLFIQRSLMNLESGVSLTSKEAQQWAQWRKWYRVWEANRKVLLYPENWIEPELRDDKSPFYKDLENELLQNDVTMDTAEDAFLHYLEKLDQVARLEIMGMYLQKEQPDTDILHVFGRTYATPHIYFYRRLEGDVWSAWEKVDLDIEGDHLIPVAWNRRLYLFWSIFTEKSEQPTKEQRKSEEDPNKYWEIKLAWSEYKNERWSSKKVSKNFLRHNKYPYPTVYLFCWEDIPGNDEEILKQFLISNYNLAWIKSARIEKTDNLKQTWIEDMTNLSNKLLLTLNEDNTELDLTILYGKTDKFHVQTENGKLIIYPALKIPQNSPLVVPLDPQDFSFKTRILHQGFPDEQLSIECYGTLVVTDVLPPEPIPITPVTENIQFLGILEPHTAKVDLFKPPMPQSTYLKCRFLISELKPNKAERANTTMQIRNSSNNILEKDIALNSNGVAYSTHGYTEVVNFWMVSKDYELEEPIKEQGSWWTPFNAVAYLTASHEAGIDAVFDSIEAVADNDTAKAINDAINNVNPGEVITGAVASSILLGPAAFSTAIAIITTAIAAASAAYSRVYSNAATNALGRLFGRGWIVNLKARTLPPPPEPPKPVYVTTVKPMQGIGEFTLNDCNGDLLAVPVAQVTNRLVPTELSPYLNTKIQNMQLVENSGEYPLKIYNDILLSSTPGIFRLYIPHQDLKSPFYLLEPFFFQDGKRTYFIQRLEVNYTITFVIIKFAIYFHPCVGEFLKALNRDGIPGLLTLQNQKLDDYGAGFMKYSPTGLCQSLDSWPKEDVDFEKGGAYSLYNWELFFHTPFLIAMQLSKNQRFEEAQKWFHYIFDPTKTDSPGRQGTPGIERFWRVKPFYEEAIGIQTLEALILDINKPEEFEKQVTEWEADPFKPHVIARIRKVAYMKAVVMRYIDNLIAWGDQLFRRETIESINEATQLYILAAQILGKRPESIPARAKAKIQTFRTLDDIKLLDSLSNALVEIESFLPPSAAPTSVKGTQGGALFMPYFCIPGNDTLLGYWDTVADRLFKIRHCMNIEGVERSLPIFEPPIDPGLLVRAAAAGVDIASALNDINAAVPHYRFNVMVQKASELCNDVKTLGGALLSALEKRDAEALSLLRSTQEVELLQAIRDIKVQQVEEAKNTHAGLLKYQDVVTARQLYYQGRLFMNPFEIGHLALTTNSLIPMGVQLGAEVTAAILHLIPNIKIAAPMSAGSTYGGDNVGPALQAFGSAAGVTASMLNVGASLSATLGSYQRRQEEWTHQADLATKELEQVKKQIAAADIRLAISESELINHDTQIENAKKVDEYMREKFTNQQLYSWMVGKLSGIYFQSYQLAYDVSKRAERAFRHELGLKDSNFIQFGYWDSLKKGLLSGERLHHDLKRMEVAYLDQNKREYEITKHISLITIDPISFVKLKETGECFISLPEALFDMDYPGHYMRRIKSVSITIPCVTGPYAGVNCTLTQHSSTIRHANTLLAGNYGRKDEDTRFSDSFGTIQSIVTSSGQNDSGLFEANMRDERYLPFEGQGAISTWRIQLPTQFKSFDYDTISDVILHLHYTAREGGDLLRNGAVENLKTMIDEAQAAGSVRLFSVRHEFPTEWARFTRVENVSSDNPAGLTLNLKPEHYPFWSIDRLETVKQLELFARTTESVEVSDKVDANGKLDEARKIALGNSPFALMTGKLPNTVDLSPTGPLTLYFGNNSMEDLWLALTWGK